MENQDTNQSRDERRPVESAFNFNNFWAGLGSGGRTIAGIFVVIAAYFIFLDKGDTNWVEIPFAEGESQHKSQFVETLRDEQVEFRYTPQGQIQVSNKNIGKVLSMLQGIPGTGVREDPFGWIRQSDSILGNTRQREQRWERSHIQRLEEDIARLDGIFSVSVTPSSASSSAVIGSNRKINGVSVQVMLNEEIRQEGISQEVARAIGLHVSGAYAITLDKIVLTDTFGHHYDLVNPKLTNGDVIDKKKKVEGYVTNYLNSIFSTDMFRVTVAVSLQEPVEDRGFIDNRFPVVRGIHDIQEQVAGLTTTSSQFADTVIARATVQQIPSYSDSDPAVNSVDEVAVTVMLDREKALAIATDRFRGTSNRGVSAVVAGLQVEETPEALRVLRGFTTEVANGIESHLKVHLGKDTDVEARVFPVRFGGFTTAAAVATPFFPGPTSQNNNFPFLVLVFFGIASIFVMLRDGPVDVPRQSAIQGFRISGSSSVAGIQAAIDTYRDEESQFSYDHSMEIIRNLTVAESVTILRQVISGTRDDLPGCEILALLILDQGGNRELIFQQLNSDELAILGELIQEAGVLTGDSIEDAMAALDLFKGGRADFSTGISLPPFVSTVPGSSNVDQSVLNDIRATDPDLAELIERNRQGSESREVQSS
ncbi:MAG: hypothetical protein CMJ95_08930 [Planctomycetes bacterium]|nr:hypothetical protein [Planctomycetota bacterium]